MERAHRLMQKGVADGVFPGGVLHVRAFGRVVFCRAYGQADIFSKEPMTPETVFDLASLTKPLATAPAVLKLVQEGRLSLRDRLGDILDDFSRTDKHDITPADLLRHTSGLPAHRQYYTVLSGLAVEARKAELTRLLAAEPLEYPPGERTVYSDLGYMILRQVVETVTGLRLDDYTRQALFKPLAIDDLFFIDLHDRVAAEHSKQPPWKQQHGQRQFAATENCPRRRRLLKGMVHDDNAYEVGGIDGQAGLFGSVAAVDRFLEEILAIYNGRGRSDVLSAAMVEGMLFGSDGWRPSGFDVPEAAGSAAGSLFSKAAAGHLGFTGTSMWMDIPRGITVLLFTNRSHPDRANDAIRGFRPGLHDAVMTALSAAGC